MVDVIRVSNKLVKSTTVMDDVYYSYWCSACNHTHSVRTTKSPRAHPEMPSWAFDGNAEAPTFNPSIREYITKEDGTQKTLCHHFVKEGNIQYCSDSPHELAGKTVPLEDIPPEYGFGNVLMKDLSV